MYQTKELGLNPVDYREPLKDFHHEIDKFIVHFEKTIDSA